MDNYLISAGFLNYNFAFLIVFVLVTAGISFFSYRVNKLVRQNQLKQFSIAFLSICLGYVMQIIQLMFVDPRMMFGMGGMRRLMHGMISWELILLNAHAILMMIGLVLLVYTTIKAQKPRILVLLVLITLVPVLFTPNSVFTFHLLATILTLFIAYHYYENYRKHKQKQTALVFLGFTFLFFAHFLLVFSLRDPLSFTIGRTLELIGYLLLLTNLTLVLRK
ncbi:hypothetical protein JW868_04610 [Candidatus Woesearchaeota archaeon]|nr:hypothetical protein [Candidatus Woesearchaeota archaeon]